MGEVYRPRDVVNRKGGKSSDLTPPLGSQPIQPRSLDVLLKEVESMKVEIRRIKQALKAHGIKVE